MALLGFQFLDFQLRSFVDLKPVELQESYILKFSPRSIRPLTWGIGYIVAQCTDTPNFIFAIKQGGLEKTLEVYNSLIAQLA